MTRNSTVSCWVYVNYINNNFLINKVKAVFSQLQKSGQIRSWSFRSNSFSDGKKVLKIVYINNILFIYTIFRRGIIFLFWFWPKWPWPNLTGITLKIYTTRKFVLKFVIIPLLWFFYITFASTYTFSNRPCCQDNRAVC